MSGFVSVRRMDETGVWRTVTVTVEEWNAQQEKLVGEWIEVAWEPWEPPEPEPEEGA